MSTKAIRLALWDMATHGAGEQPRLADEARAELEAIERAAGEVRVWGIGPVVLPESSTAPTQYREECEKRRLAAYKTLARVAAKETT